MIRFRFRLKKLKRSLMKWGLYNVRSYYIIHHQRIGAVLYPADDRVCGCVRNRAAFGVEAEEMNDQKKQIEEAVELLQKNFEKAKVTPYVQRPLAWALYQTWKAVDGGMKGGESDDRN